MIYTFIGEKDLIETEINKIIKDYQEENITSYNLEEIPIDKPLEDLNTISLFGKKLVRVDNFEKVSSPEDLIKYIENKSDNTLILTSTKSINSKTKLGKIIKEKTKVIELFKYDYVKYIKENLENYEMSIIDINLLISYCNNDINRIKNELDKLKLYKLEEKKITSGDIKKLVKKSYDSTIFNLIDNINMKNKSNIYKIYKELLKEGETDEKIMYTIANHYRLLFNIKNKLKYMKSEEIISEYKMHPYRLTKLKEQLEIVTEEEIINILKTLSNIDIEVKKGNKDINTELILFFENL